MKAWLDYFADKALDGTVWLSKFVMYNLAIFLSFVWRNTKVFAAWLAPKVKTAAVNLWEYIKNRW